MAALGDDCPDAAELRRSLNAVRAERDALRIDLQRTEGMRLALAEQLNRIAAIIGERR